MNDVITEKRVIRDDSGYYIVGVKLLTNHKRTYVFEGRTAALWANSHFQPLQSISPAMCVGVQHVIEARKAA